MHGNAAAAAVLVLPQGHLEVVNHPARGQSVLARMERRQGAPVVRAEGTAQAVSERWVTFHVPTICLDVLLQPSHHRRARPDAVLVQEPSDQAQQLLLRDVLLLGTQLEHAVQCRGANVALSHVGNDAVALGGGPSVRQLQHLGEEFRSCISPRQHRAIHLPFAHRAAGDVEVDAEDVDAHHAKNVHERILSRALDVRSIAPHEEAREHVDNQLGRQLKRDVDGDVATLVRQHREAHAEKAVHEVDAKRGNERSAGQEAETLTDRAADDRR
mmetsp:Transcript_2027/g.5732  ORF Transcript_2027/g.5732 Transcript_2027/m.5732 type:complete len:271 (+) Transcript_2027:113-925(+)